MSRAFETAQGPKQTCRDLICDIADQEIGQVKKLFTLPSREALCYHTFTSRYPKAKVACIERDADICSHLWDQGIDCSNTTVRQYCNERTRPEQHHDVVFLDYYSFLTEDILDDLKAFLKNDNILHPGKPFVFAITLMKGMRAGKEETLDALRAYAYDGDDTPIENTLETVTRCLKGMIACEFVEFEDVRLVTAIEYRAGKGSAQMYFAVFSITKENQVVGRS